MTILGQATDVNQGCPDKEVLDVKGDLSKTDTGIAE
jgi:hypothetical protein